MAFLEYDPHQTLFHYTNPEAFNNILSSKKLWFSDLTKSNDPRELSLGYIKVIEALKSVRHDEYSGDRGLFLSVMAAKLAGLRQSHTAYCCCFTLSGDSLPLWNEYTKYEGLSIGFRPSAIRNIQARLQKTRYFAANNSTDIRNKIMEIAQPFNPESLNEDPNFWVNSSVEMYSVITSMKHSTWEYENEVRMVHIQENAQRVVNSAFLNEINEIDPWLTPKIRKRGEEEISYLEAPFGRYRDGERAHCRAIESVTIGPKCNFQIEDVEALLRKYGYENVAIFKSECAIR